MTICEAIAKEEGFGVSGGRATRNNNPGDINYGSFAISHGADHIEVIPEGHNITARFAHFPDVVTGFRAMRILLQAHYGGMTIEQMINKYAPPSENNTAQYIKNVCIWTGLPSNTIIDQYL